MTIRYCFIRNQKKIITIFSAVVSVAQTQLSHAESYDYNFTGSIPQSDYENIVQPLVNASRFKFMSFPGPSVGKIIPLSVSVGAGFTYLKFSDKTKNSINNYSDSNGSFPDTAIIPRFIGQVGLPFGLDLAVNYAKVPNSKIELKGFAAQFGIFNPKLLPISSAIRIGYTEIANYTPFKSSTTNLEGLVGIPLPFLKPYGGFGINWSKASTSVDVTSGSGTVHLSNSSSWTEYYGTLGLHVSLIPFIGLDFSGDISGTQVQYNAKISLDI